MKREFFDTIFAHSAGLDIGVNRMLKYLVTNQPAVYNINELTAMTRQIRSVLKTPMSEIFDKIISVANNAIYNFTAINVSSKDTSIPELLTMSNVTLDLAHLPGDTHVLDSLPNLKGKILVNLTGVVKESRGSDEYVINAVDVLQNLFVRGQFVATYHDKNNDWAASSTQCLLYLQKSYSMVLSSMIAQYYNLDIEDIQKVATILTLYMDYTCGGSLHNPITINRWDWCGPMPMRKSLCSACEEYLDDQGVFSLISVATALSKLINMRMSNFNMESIIAICGRLGPDAITSRIALEFPPYWMYLIVSALSGNKIPLFFRISKDRELMRDGNVFLNALYMNHAILAKR